jgi:uncharacterized protein (DUF1330 family)
MKYLDVTNEAGARFFGSNTEGPVVMLNLLKFKDQAVFPEGKDPGHPMTGTEAYQLYMKHTSPHIKKAGAEVVFMGQADHFLIGPEAESWDMVLLVKHQSKEKFLAFARNEGYLETAYYRNAALEDSRLLPMQ